MDSLERPPRSLLLATADADRVPFSVALDREARRHVRALRLKDGARIRVTNGRGAMWEGRVEGTAAAPAFRLEATLTVESPLPLVLGFAVAAKTRTLWLVEKAVELGVGALCPIEFIRSASVADAARSSAFWTKARRRAEAALEQCGGAWLPELRAPVPLGEFLAGAGADPADPRGPGHKVLLLPSAERELVQCLSSWTGRNGLTILAGPEGGLETSEEEAVITSGFETARLGERILRFETAAIAAVAVASQRAAAEPRTDATRHGARAGIDEEE